MPRVGLVIGQLTWGGAERQLYELAVRIGERGWTPHVYCLSEEDKPYREKLESRGVKVRLFKRASHFDILRAFRLRRALRADRVDLVHSWLLNDNAYTALSQFPPSLPWISSLRSRPNDRDFLRSGIDRWAFARSRAVLVNEREIVAYSNERYRCPTSKVVIVPNGIDLERLRQKRPAEEVRRELGTPADVPVILFAGRLEAVKNLPLLLNSFSEVTRWGLDSRLWIVGDGSEKANVLRQVERLSLKDRVLLTGVRSDLPDLFHAADVFVLCSNSEGLPNVVLESMACGTPVIVSPHSGCSEAVEDGVNGWISPNQEPATYSELIRHCLQNPEERKRIGERARTTIRDRFSPEEMVRKVSLLYTRILEGDNLKG